MDCMLLAQEIIDGRRLGREDDLTALVRADLKALERGADSIRKHFTGEHIDLCTIISGKSGKCSENCKFCAQAGVHHTQCEVYDLLSEEEIFQAAKANEEEGVARFSIVNSGRSPLAKDFEKILAVFRRMNRELSIELCTSLGFMTEEQFRKLKEAGVASIHCNLETSRRYFPSICTTHTYDEKIANIKRARKAGLSVCSGGIIGMGETWQDRIDMALELKELGILSIPINSLMPIPGTPLANLPRLTEEEILRTVAVFRYINPEADIRLAGGRALMKENGKETFTAGASASITGNMLTTSGSTIRSDMEMLKGLGRDVTPSWKK